MQNSRRILGDADPSTLRAMNNFANRFYETGRDKEAEEIQNEILENRRKLLGTNHLDTISTLDSVARRLAA